MVLLLLTRARTMPKRQAVDFLLYFMCYLLFVCSAKVVESRKFTNPISRCPWVVQVGLQQYITHDLEHYASVVPHCSQERYVSLQSARVHVHTGTVVIDFCASKGVSLTVARRRGDDVYVFNSSDSSCQPVVVYSPEPETLSFKFSEVGRCGSVLPLINISSITAGQHLLSCFYPRRKNERKVHLVTFGDCIMKSRLSGFVEEAESTGFFDYIHAFTIKDLEPSFRERHKSLLNSGSGRCGYWIYKPQIVLQTFQRMKEGDVLAYADVGCTFNVNKSSLLRALSFLTDNSIPLVCYSLVHPEHMFTKSDTLKAMSVLQNRSITDTGQVAATTWFLQKTTRSIEFMLTWLRWMEMDDYRLLDDSPSATPNHRGFRDHRHDQSIFSVLTKIHGLKCLPDETWPPENAIAPIKAARCRRRQCTDGK